jgi:hypothetical protein
MRRIVIAAALGALLALPAVASAKGPIEKIDVCGDGGECTQVTDDSATGGPTAADNFFGPPPPSDRVPPPGDFYRVTMFMAGDDAGFDAYFVPKAGLLFDPSGNWIQPSRVMVHALREAAARVEPIPFELKALEVDGTAVADPQAFLPLLTLSGETIDAPVAGADADHLRSLSITTTDPTPWTGVISPYFATYDEQLRAVHVGGGIWQRVPADLADRLDAVAPPPAAAVPEGSGGSGAPWALIAVAAAALIAAAVAIGAARRRLRGRAAPVA